MSTVSHMCPRIFADLFLQYYPGTVQRTPTGNTATIAMPEGCVFVPEYEVYNLKNGMSYIKKV